MAEDWGGDGSSGMNLSRRDTAKNKFRKSELSYFSIAGLLTERWKVGELEIGSRVRLTWSADNNAGTYLASIAPGQGLKGGYFTTDVEIFVVSGSLQLGDWSFGKHGYTFIPAGVCIGSLTALDVELGKSATEILWMENGPGQLNHVEATEHTSGGCNRLSEFVPPLDANFGSWVGGETSQFSFARKKWLRRAPNGGGCWCLALLPHYDSGSSMIQCYNEEALCLSGTCDIGPHRFTEGKFGYVPSFTTSPQHASEDGCMFFVRVDRDLSKHGVVITHKDMPPPIIDWTTAMVSTLPGPAAGIVPTGFLRHIGTWCGTYTHLDKSGAIVDKHDCKLEIGIHGFWYSQRNTYTWHDEGGKVTKTEQFLFPGRFDRSGVVWFDADKISGHGRTLDADGTVLFYGRYNPGKAAMGTSSEVDVDTYDLIRIVDTEGQHRYRTWQVKAGSDLLKIVHVYENRSSSENTFWIPRQIARSQL